MVIRRGLVFDLNAAAATAGVLLDSPLRQARIVCPDLQSSPLIEVVYQERIKGLVNAISQETNRFEFDSINGLFVDFAGVGEPSQALQRVLGATFGFEIVAGLGRSKLSAKVAVLAALASGTYHRQAMFFPKPAPVVRVVQSKVSACGSEGAQADPPVLRLVDLVSGDAASEQGFLATLPIGYLWPASADMRDRLYKLGIKTFGDLAAINSRDVCRVVGSEGARLVELATGRDGSSLIRTYAPDEVVRRLDFDHPISAKLVLKRSLTALGEDLGRSLTAEGLGCHTLSLVLHLANEEITASRAFSRPKGEPAAIGRAAGGLLDTLRLPSEVYGVEVRAHGFVHAGGEQISFLAKAVGQSQEDSLLKTLSALERRFPGGTVRLGPPPTSRRERMLQLVDPLRRTGSSSASGADS